MLPTSLNFGGILSEPFSTEILHKISNPFFSSQTFCLPHIRNGWSSWCETKRKWANWILRWLGYLWNWLLTLTFDLQFSRSNCISGMEGPIVMEQKWRESIGCPDVKHQGNKPTECCIDWGTFDLDLWLWVFKVKLYLGNGRTDCHGTNRMGVDRMSWYGTQPLCGLEAEDTVRDWGDLRYWHFRWLV